jgi:hypothetical protein
MKRSRRVARVLFWARQVDAGVAGPGQCWQLTRWVRGARTTYALAQLTLAVYEPALARDLRVVESRDMVLRALERVTAAAPQAPAGAAFLRALSAARDDMYAGRLPIGV